MSSPLDRYQDYVDSLTGYWGATGEFQVIRPDYTGSTEQTIGTGIPFRIDRKGASTQVQNPLPGVNYVVAAGAKSLVFPGDVIIPQEDDGSTMPVTVIQNLKMSDVTAIRTCRMGTIITTTRTNDPPLYTLVRFDFVAVASQYGAVIPEFEESKHMETSRAVIFYRDNVTKGKRLIDQATSRRYMILAVHYRENQLLLQLQGDTG